MGSKMNDEEVRRSAGGNSLIMDCGNMEPAIMMDRGTKHDPTGKLMHDD